MKKRRRLFNLPNTLTLSRLFLAPVVLVLLPALQRPEDAPQAWHTTAILIGVLTVTLLTDLFDGMAARAYKEVTNFGKIMDPIADSTFFMTLLIGLAACPRFGHNVTIWFPVLVLYREVVMHILRRYAALKGHAMPAKMSGKVKMFVQSIAMAFFFLLVMWRDGSYAAGVCPAWLTEELLGSVVFWVCGLTVVLNYASLIEYSHDIPELIAEYQPEERQ